jgi:glycosyltransferase involved in cell wall biosynthesis
MAAISASVITKSGRPVSLSSQRIALFSGNYNYVKDGAALALNRLVGYLLREGAQVLVFSPTTDAPAFPSVGEVVSVPSVAMPGNRGEYRFAGGVWGGVRERLAAFRPTLFHLSAPDWLGYTAQRTARRWQVPAVASFHTRYETYLDYYGLGFLRPLMERYLRAFYNGCCHVYAPNQAIEDLLRAQGVTTDVRRWGRGVDADLFSPRHRSAGWRSDHAIGPDELVVGFVGRLVREKGLDRLIEVSRGLTAAGTAHRLVIAGDGPERDWLQGQLPRATFLGFLDGEALAAAYANADVYLNPSITEAFANVVLEAMACGVPQVCANATGANTLVSDGHTGLLVDPQAFTPRAIEAIGQLARTPLRRRAFAATSRRVALAHSWDAVMAELGAHYRELLLPQGRAAPAAASGSEPRPALVYG